MDIFWCIIYMRDIAEKLCLFLLWKKGDKRLEIKNKSNLIGQKSEKMVYNYIRGIYPNAQLVTDIEIQKHYGDITYRKWNKDHYIEVKTAHNFNNMNKLAIDVLYFEKKHWCTGLKPYIPSNSTDNKGWLYNLDKCNRLMVVTKQKEIYDIRGWQRIRENIIKAVDLSDITFRCMWEYPLEIENRYLDLMLNKRDKLKDTVCVTFRLEEKIIEALGGELIECKKIYN